MHSVPDFKQDRQLAAVRILLLEDDEVFAGLVRSNLEYADWGDLSIAHAATLRDALAWLEDGGFDLVITDLNLPDSKGLDTVESLVRATDRLIVVLTGERDEGLREAAIAQGAYDLMSKDRLDRAELGQLVRLAAMQAKTFSSLRKSEQRYRSLMELSADWYWEQDAELRFVVTAGATDARGGITAESHIGKCRWELPHTEILGQTWQEHKSLLQARQPFHDLLLRRTDANNETHYISVSGRPVFDERGAFCGYRGVAKDVTLRVRMDLRLAIEHSVTRVLEESNSIAEAMPRIIRVICESLGWACGARSEHDERNQVIRFAETWGVASAGIDEFLEATRRLPAPSTQPGGLNRRAWAEGKPTWIRDVTQDASFLRAPEAAKAGLHSAFAFPIKVGAQAIGVMEFFSSEIHQPDAELLECMTYVGSQIGQFMQRKRAEEEQRRFRAAVDVSADFVMLVDPAGMRYVDANETACRTLGYSREELLAMGPHEIYSASREDLARLYERLIAGDLSAAESEGWYRGKDGSRLLVESFRRAVPSTNGHVIVVVAREIGERRRAEQLLKLEHTVTRALAEADNASATLKAVIRAVCETEGWECGRYFYADDEAGVLRFGEAWSIENPAIERFIAGAREVSYALGVGLMGQVWQSGQPLWVADVEKDTRTVQKAVARELGLHGAIFFPVMGEGKVIGVLAFNSREVRAPDERLLQAVRVIGSQIGQFVQRKQAEEVRRESEERFRSLTELSSDFYWESDAEHRIIRTGGNKAHRAVVNPAQMGKQRWETPSTYPDAAGWAAHRATMEAHLPFRDFEIARLDDDSIERYRSISGEPVFDAAGLFKGYRGVGKDITARRQAEERQATHLRYQEKIARFGASALGKREASDLVEDALQNVLEALPTTVVVYVEPGGGARELVMRGCAGLALGDPAAVACYGNADAVARALEHGELAIVDRPISGAALLPFEWAAAFRCAALVPVHGDNRVLGALCVLSEEQGAFGDEESKFLVTAASVLSAGLRRIDSEGRLAVLAQFDTLTGLPNRALLSDRFSQLIVQARRHATQLGVLFIDLDDFKLVNDSMGHAGGDDLLREVARRLQSAVRAGDTVARISGDEFAVILADLARPDDAALVAQKIIERLAAPMQVRGHEIFVTASIGISAFPADGGDAEALLGAADAAMYRAKQSGRNGYQFFTTEINQRTRARAQLGSELRRALEREEFALVYQPKYDLQTGRPCAAEALLRWNHPERGVVSPAEFIPVLEETGLIVAVGEWVLQRACKDVKAWQAEGAVVVPVAVNLSARQFRQQDLDLRFIGLVKAAGVEPKLIELEITESQLMHDPDHAIRVMRSLSAAGIRIAIDDFGTGYSSLSYLTRFPVAALKIDRSFVADVLSDKAAAAIVRTIIDMAHTLGSIVIAEGVETEAQAALLRSLGCEQAQGYFFARPVPEADLRALLSSYTKPPPRKARAVSRGR
jgi:diguanylate cyclase (GGDEF)-like protein/PAS domain S-box-containing protein